MAQMATFQAVANYIPLEEDKLYDTLGTILHGKGDLHGLHSWDAANGLYGIDIEIEHVGLSID